MYRLTGSANWIISPFPGKYATGESFDIGITELLRPHSAVVGTSAFHETAINYNEAILVRTKQLDILLGSLAVGLSRVPFVHRFDGEKELHRARDVIFVVAGFKRHGVDDQ